MILIADIQAAVAAEFNLPLEWMDGASRRRSVARPRQIAMYLSRKLTARSYPMIAARFRRDHSTVLYAARIVPAMLASDKALAARVALIERDLLIAQACKDYRLALANGEL